MVSIRLNAKFLIQKLIVIFRLLKINFVIRYAMIKAFPNLVASIYTLFQKEFEFREFAKPNFGISQMRTVQIENLGTLSQDEMREKKSKYC